MTGTVLAHPFSDEGMRDPYPILAAFRRVKPAFFDRSIGLWLLTSHELCRVALRHPGFSAAQGQQQRVRADDLPVSMLNTDGIDHDRLRTPAAAAFAARATLRHAAAFESAAADVLSALPAAGSGLEIDIVSAIARPFAEKVIGLVTGTPRESWPELGRLAAAASANLNPVLRGEQAQAASRAATALNCFLAVEAPDVLDGSSDLTSGERLALTSLIVVGGFEPLADVCATTLSLVLDSPDAHAALAVGEPELLAGAVDEAMRLESPIPFTSRVCVTGYTSEDVAIPAGSPVLAMLGAANRDPAVYDSPDEFRIDRRPNPHLALGGGAHYCLGAALVKLSTAILLGQILTTRPTVRRRPGHVPQWRPTLVPRGLQSLFLTW